MPPIASDALVLRSYKLGETLPEARCVEILEEALRLERGPVVRELIDTLGLRGTAAAVAPLRAVVEAHAFDRRFGREADQAIVRIQSRLDDAEAGQVSIAGRQTSDGHLSLGDGAPGRLSLDQPVGERSNVPSKPVTKADS